MFSKKMKATPPPKRPNIVSDCNCCYEFLFSQAKNFGLLLTFTFFDQQQKSPGGGEVAGEGWGGARNACGWIPHSSAFVMHISPHSTFAGPWAKCTLDLLSCSRTSLGIGSRKCAMCRSTLPLKTRYPPGSLPLCRCGPRLKQDKCASSEHSPGNKRRLFPNCLFWFWTSLHYGIKGIQIEIVFCLSRLFVFFRPKIDATYCAWLFPT